VDHFDERTVKLTTSQAAICRNALAVKNNLKNNRLTGE
jgi:hypothetical protein